ncbi:MAG: hypothetical protein WC823_00135 [Parcubacteria group bacterium]|jgi:hypothetical protein
MNINKFKEGDIVTRNNPCDYDHNGIKDSSYCGDRLLFCGLDEKAKIIFYKHTQGILKSADICTLSYARDNWDEGWEYYPDSMLEKIKDKFSKNN